MSRRHSFAALFATPIPPGMTPALAAAAEARPRRATTRTRTGWAASASLLLHLGLLLLAFLAANQVRKLAEPVPAIPVDVIFQGGSKTPPSVPTPGKPSQTRPGSPPPQPTVKPVPPTPPPATAAPPPSPPVQASPKPEPAPAPQTTPTPAPQPAPPNPSVQQQTAPQPPAPLVLRRQMVPLQPAPVQTPETVPPPPGVQVEPSPALPLPPPAVRAPAAPQARELPRRPSAFPAPMEFSLHGRPAAQPRPAEHHAAPRPGTIDLSFAPTSGGSRGLQIHAEADGEDVGPDWLNRVAAWWARHGYYPDEAARLGQHGDVTISMKVAHSGHVERLGVTQASNSPWLNLGALSVFRNADLPPLPPDVTANNIDLTFTIHYIIVN